MQSSKSALYCLKLYTAGTRSPSGLFASDMKLFPVPGNSPALLMPTVAQPNPSFSPSPGTNTLGEELETLIK